MGTSGVGLGWAAANVRDLENGRFQNPGSVSSQQQQQASKVLIFSQKMMFSDPYSSASGDQRPPAMGMGRVPTRYLYP